MVGEAPVQIGSVPGLAVWMFAPLGVELRCLPLPRTQLAVVLGLVWSWYVSFPGGFGYHVCSPVSSLTSGEVGFVGSLVDLRRRCGWQTIGYASSSSQAFVLVHASFMFGWGRSC